MRFVKSLVLAGLLGTGLALSHAAPAAAATWIPRHYAPNGAFIPGHWAGTPNGRHWVPGFYGPAGGWHPGHWALN